MFNKIFELIEKPDLFSEGTAVFWKDDHISKYLLEAHLDPESEAASRKPEFIDRSVNWIYEIAPPAHHKKLLDMGCGPGLYAERFAEAGYDVTGIDFSQRSIKYAREQAASLDLSITYHEQDYTAMDFANKFDLITLIYCDFGVLSSKSRQNLLSKVYAALKPHGKLILDVFTPVRHMDKPESHTWEYYRSGGFWSANSHICLQSFYRYDEDNTVMDQTIVIEDEKITCYNIWEQCFTKCNIALEMEAAGFSVLSLYGSIDGNILTASVDTICGVYIK